MRIERIGGSRLDTWGLDQTTGELIWAGEGAMWKRIPALRQAGYESISNLPRIEQSCREKALVKIPQAMRICATSNGEQRVQVLILVVQGLAQKQRQSMQPCFELWIGKDSSCHQPRGGNEIVWKVLNAQSKCGKAGYVLRKNSQNLVKSCLKQNCYQPSARNRVQIQQRETQAKRSLDEER